MWSDFEWGRPNAGVDWTEMEIPSKSGASLSRTIYLWEELEAGERADFKVYRPLTLTGLHRDFAEIATWRNGMAEFAARYGFLGSPLTISTNRPRPDAPDHLNLVWAEPLDDWVNEIHMMKAAVMLWDAISQSDVDHLQEFIHWREPSERGRSGLLGDVYFVATNQKHFPREVQLRKNDGKVHSHIVGIEKISKYDHPLPSLFPIAGKNIREALMPRMKDTDVLAPARIALQKILNTQLDNHAIAAELNGAPGVDLRIRFKPKSLIGALWLQLAWAIDGKRDYRRCDYCTRWFDPVEQRRRGSRFCKDSCRVNSYKKKKRLKEAAHDKGNRKSAPKKKSNRKGRNG